MNDTIKWILGLAVALGLSVAPSGADEAWNQVAWRAKAPTVEIGAPGVTLLGGSNALALRGSSTGNLTRFERSAAMSSDLSSDQPLMVLGDADFATEAPAQPTPTPLVSVVTGGQGKPTLESDFAPPVFSHDASMDEVPWDESEPDLGMEITLGWSGLVMVVTLYCMRRRVFDLFNWAVFTSVASLRGCRTCVAGRSRRRRRHSRRRRGADVSWYFQAERNSSRGRRWRSRAGRREFVVADVVVDHGSAGYSPTISGRYLLTCNNN